MEAIFPNSPVKLTRVVTELDAADRPFRPPEEAVHAGAVKLGDPPVFIEAQPPS